VGPYCTGRPSHSGRRRFPARRIPGLDRTASPPPSEPDDFRCDRGQCGDLQRHSYVAGCTSAGREHDGRGQISAEHARRDGAGDRRDGLTNRTASVPAHAGSAYAWTIGNGTITAGQGTNQITFTAGVSGVPLTLSVTETNAPGCVSAPGSATVTVAPAGSAVLFYTLPPCRLLDTRNTPAGPLAGPSLQAGQVRTFALAGVCGIPGTARAISANATITSPLQPGFLTLYPADVVKPLASSINFMPDKRAPTTPFYRSPSTDRFDQGLHRLLGAVQFILDVNGYFQ